MSIHSYSHARCAAKRVARRRCTMQYARQQPSNGGFEAVRRLHCPGRVGVSRARHDKPLRRGLCAPPFALG